MFLKIYLVVTTSYSIMFTLEVLGKIRENRYLDAPVLSVQ